MISGHPWRVPLTCLAGRMGQLGKIHYINTKAFFESARHVMIVHGGYTDAEVDILCGCSVCPCWVDFNFVAQAYLAEIDKGQLYTRYHALSIIKL